MKTLIKNELRQNARVLLIWLGLTVVLVGFCFFEYLSLRDSIVELGALVGSFPKLMRVMFGVKADLATPLGWYACLYFWTTILAFGYAAYLGVSCVAKEEQQRTAEYLFTRPVDRGQIVRAKAAACALDLLVYTVCSGVCSYFLVVLPAGGLENNADVLLTTLGMYLTELVFFSGGLWIAAVVRRYSAAVRGCAAFVLGAYAVGVAVQYADAKWLEFLSPLCYFDAYGVIMDGLRPGYLLLAVALVALCLTDAVRRWKAREIY